MCFSMNMSAWRRRQQQKNTTNEGMKGGSGGVAALTGQGVILC